jgi:hypothetical protein
MESERNRIIAPIAAFALIAGLQSGVANAGKSGDYFEDGPQCCAQNTDLSGIRWLEASTADAFVNGKGVLQLGSSSRGPLYTDEAFWISNVQYSSNGATALWNVANREALRKGFSFWPTNRVRVLFDSSGSNCTGYLAAYSSRGALLVQATVTFTSDVTRWLDTGTTKGRIGYILASYSGTDCGKLSTIGYWVSVH